MLADGVKVIRECETRLRELVSRAAGSGDYDAVATLNDWAKTLAAIANSADPTAPAQVRVDPAHVPVITRQTKKPTGRNKYPRFERYRTELVKIGWSKKERKEYQHRAPRRVVELLAARLSAFQGKDFTTEEILPLIADDGQEVPTYQAYLCLAWLRESGIVTKNGRQGYFIESTGNFTAKAEHYWQSLPTRTHKG